jgi:hypothetical protein
MAKYIQHINFKGLRDAYIEVKTFIEIETGDDVFSLKTKIEEDLGCAGNDNYDLLKKFVEKYNLDYQGFDYSKHFLSEGELFGSFGSLLNLTILPLIGILWLIKIVSFRKLDLNEVIDKVLGSVHRPTVDLTFGDMIAWYLTRKYCLRTDVKFELTNHK